jgi:hypothetical protein
VQQCKGLAGEDAWRDRHAARAAARHVHWKNTPRPEALRDFREALNYADCLLNLERFEEARAFLRKTMPVARRVLGDSHDYTLAMRKVYADALYRDSSATLDDLRKAVTTLEDTTRIARRVLGGTHPLTTGIEKSLQNARVIRARKTPPPSPPSANM